MRNRGRTKILFQPPAAGNDGFGPNPAAGDWGPGVSIGVNLTPRRGSETEVNGVVISGQIYECEIRNTYVQGDFRIDTTWRASDATGRTFNIVAIAQRDDDFRFFRVTLATGERP